MSIEVKNIVKTKEVVTVVEEVVGKTYALTLSEREAHFLRTLLGATGGPHVARMYSLLKHKTDIAPDEVRMMFPLRTLEGHTISKYFSQYSDQVE